MPDSLLTRNGIVFRKFNVCSRVWVSPWTLEQRKKFHSLAFYHVGVLKASLTLDMICITIEMFEVSQV